MQAVASQRQFASEKADKLKHLTLGALLDVEMLKKRTPPWREAHVQVESEKLAGHEALLDVQMSFCVAGTPSTVSQT